MLRETKFGYGFLLVGTGVPYLIDKMFGLFYAIFFSVACVLLGGAFLLAGHHHKEGEVRQPKKVWEIVAFGTALCSLAILISIGITRATPILTITPSDVLFSSVNQAFDFYLSNEADHKVYRVVSEFTIYSPILTGTEFSINIPPVSTKSFSEASPAGEHFADLQGMTCRDKYNNVVFLLVAKELNAHEERKITITKNVAGNATVSAKIATSTSDPQSYTIDTNSISFQIDFPFVKNCIGRIVTMTPPKTN